MRLHVDVDNQGVAFSNVTACDKIYYYVTYVTYVYIGNYGCVPIASHMANDFIQNYAQKLAGLMPKWVKQYLTIRPNPF